MKGNTSLTESIGSARGESETAYRGDSTGISPGRADDRGDRSTESVVITITATTGYEDSETFTVHGKKATNAFARRLMAVAIRAYERHDGDAGE
jgi:hypothetical protein